MIPQILNVLYEKNIQSIIIEGGATTLQNFIDTKQWDEARVLRGTPNFGNGLKAPQIVAKIKEIGTFAYFF